MMHAMADSAEIRKQLEDCIRACDEGTLTAADLRAAAGLLENSPQRQQLLFLRSEGPTINAGMVGMLLYVDGQRDEGPADPDDWPYQTVAGAIDDGWRVIKFPELALCIDERQTYEVGHEFVLEKWG